MFYYYYDMEYCFILIVLDMTMRQKRANRYRVLYKIRHFNHAMHQTPTKFHYTENAQSTTKRGN